MTDDGRVAALLADRPDLESPLAALLDVDDEAETWTFDDVPVDSGAFGELVARDIVERDGDEYRLADPEAVRGALDGDVPGSDSATSDSSPSIAERIPLPAVSDVHTHAIALLAGALALVVAMRSFVTGAIFRDEAVVLSGNDPYFYLYWTEESLRTGESLSDLPGGIEHGEPLLVATLAWFADLFGGVDSAGAVLAVYPVVTAALTGLVLYWLTLQLTADRRVALAAVVILAVMPGHALRTALGFADHHAFDYVWLILTAAALVSLRTVRAFRDLAAPGPWVTALVLGVSIGAQTLAWDSGPLMIVPVGAIVAAGVLLDVRANRSPVVTQAPVLVGLTVGALLALYGHRSLGWQTDIVITAPMLLVAGTVALTAVAELTHRLGRGAGELAIAQAVVTLAGVWVVRTNFPEFWTTLLSRLDSKLFRSDDIVEVRALVDGDTLPFLLLFGFFLFVALPVLAWATRRTLESDRWVVPCLYTWYFLALSLFQVRFTGQLGIFTALFAAVGFVWLAATIDLAEPPAPFDTADSPFADWVPDRPDASTLGALALLFVLVCGMGTLQTAIKVEQVTHEPETYETAAHLAAFADDQGWESPGERYVFSAWGDNRLYNYFVNGDSRSYGYAQSNYQAFVAQTDPADATAMIDGRVRFIVTEDLDAPPGTMHARLHTQLGSREDDTDGLGRYRALYATGDGQYKAFVFVPGATVRGTAEPNATVEVATDVEIPGETFTYERRTVANETGAYDLRVAHPGTYDITTGGETNTVRVPETAVMNGTSVAVSGDL